MAAALLFFGFSFDIFALTIGQPQEGVWIGKPLNLTIPLGLDVAESATGLCLAVEAVQGDSRIDEQQLSVSVEPGANPLAPRMHVRSTRTIDEPFLTLTVKAGCDMRSTRRYVLFADVPPASSLPSTGVSGRPQFPSSREPVPSASPTSAVRRGATARSTSASSSITGKRSAIDAPSRQITSRVIGAASPDAKLAELPVRKAAKPAVTPVRKEAASVPRTRLQVDAFDLAPSADSMPKTVATLVPTVGAAGGEAPVPSANTALTGSVNAPSEVASQEALRLKSLETTLVGLRQQIADNQRTLVEMRSELSEARRSQYANPLMYALVFLLLLALTGLALLWRIARRANAAIWWGGGASELSTGKIDNLPVVREVASSNADASHVNFHPTTHPAQLQDDTRKQVDEVSENKSELHAPLNTKDDGVAHRDGKFEELFGVQQEAEFFVALGQHDQAIAALKDHIAANPATSANAYLDLLTIYQSLGRQDEYLGLRLEFMRAFNTEVPEFSGFAYSGELDASSAHAGAEEDWPMTAAGNLEPAVTAPSRLETDLASERLLTDEQQREFDRATASFPTALMK